MVERGSFSLSPPPFLVPSHPGEGYTTAAPHTPPRLLPHPRSRQAPQKQPKLLGDRGPDTPHPPPFSSTTLPSLLDSPPRLVLSAPAFAFYPLSLPLSQEAAGQALLTAEAEGEDNLKKMQLMELAILNGTYRDTNLKTPAAAAAQGTRLIAGPPGQVLPPQGMRPPTPGGPPLMNLIRPQMAAMLPNGAPTLVPSSPDGGIIYTTPYDYPYALAPTSLLEYPIEHSGVLGKRPWGGMGAAPSFSQPGQEGSLFYPGGVLDAASMSHNQDLFKGKYVVST
ncbi:unnamed protein product [Merluccius merluccius]